MIANAATIRRRLSENLKRVRERVENACTRSRRDPNAVHIIAVTKYVELDVVRQLMELGVQDLGESRAQQFNQRAGMIQELNERRSVLAGRRDASAYRPRWHMIGHLQRNKVKLVIPWAEIVHSVDSLRLAEDLHEQASKVGRVVDILLQINTSGEKTKYGVAVGAAPHLAEHFSTWSGIRLCGLMTMAPLGGTPYEVRLAFERLRDVFDDMREERTVGPHFKEVSMGMSDDFEVAIEAGATMVRIGRALFDGLMTATEDEDEAADS